MSTTDLATHHFVRISPLRHDGQRPLELGIPETGVDVTVVALDMHSLRIVSATYEPTQRNFNDMPYNATQALSTALNGQGQFAFSPSNGLNTLVGCDPFPNRPKILRVALKAIPIPHTLIIREGGHQVTISALVGFHLRLATATYEPEDGQLFGAAPCNVTHMLASDINGHDSFTIVPKAAGGLNARLGGDPYPNRVKVLRIVYDMVPA